MKSGLMREGVVKLRNLVIPPALALAVMILGAGVANAKTFSNNAIKGGYGCLASIEQVDGVGFQFVSDGKGGVTSGRGAFNLDGEVCEFTVNSAGSSYTVNADGTGTLTVEVSALSDPDGDASAGCSAEFGGSSMHYGIVVESNGHRIDVSGRDPFFTGGVFTFSDPDDVSFSGACNRQTGQ